MLCPRISTIGSLGLSSILLLNAWTGAMAQNAVQVGCNIRTSKSETGTRLEAVIRASGPVSGTYRFKVDPEGGGAPLVSEEASFAIESAGSSEVKNSGMNLPSGSGYRASLTVEWPNGMSSCSASVS